MALTVAIVGRPNVGKSTLFNRLIGKRLALVDDTPGVTRDRREGRGRLGDLEFTLFDTAGLEEAKAGSLSARMTEQTRRAVAEADLARRVMHAARRHQTLPKGLSGGLMTAHDKRPFPDAPEEIAATAGQVRDPNFRVQVSEQGLHVYNRDGIRLAQDAFALWPQLGLENDAAHAFYMGVELAHATLAWKLGKRYVQDQPLDWGVAVPRPPADTDAWCAPGTTLTHKTAPAAAPAAPSDAAPAATDSALPEAAGAAPRADALPETDNGEPAAAVPSRSSASR